MGKNTVRKLTPFIDTDIFAAESWLSDMAAKGLFFKDSSVWQNVIFEKGEPAERKYRLVPAGFVELSMISEEEKEIYSSAGWHYAGVFQQCGSRVFYTDDVNAEEIYTDSDGLDFFYKKSIAAGNCSCSTSGSMGVWIYRHRYVSDAGKLCSRYDLPAGSRTAPCSLCGFVDSECSITEKETENRRDRARCQVRLETDNRQGRSNHPYTHGDFQMAGAGYRGHYFGMAVKTDTRLNLHRSMGIPSSEVKITQPGNINGLCVLGIWCI